jgi:hypothetical protein
MKVCTRSRADNSNTKGVLSSRMLVFAVTYTALRTNFVLQGRLWRQTILLSAVGDPAISALARDQVH